MLELNLRHRFPGFALEASLSAPTPGVTTIFGPSGCGKSTILAAVAGLLRPLEGRILLDGAVLFDSAQGRMVPPEQRRCGVVFQDSRLFPHLSVEGAQGPEMEEVVALLGIGGLLRRRPAALSGGEKQRVALGRALLSRPRLLLMDEPLAALDAGRKAEVLPFLSRLRERLNIPILYVTHALDEVDRLADWLVLMEAGRVLACGTPEALSARTDLPILSARRDAGVVLGCTVLGHVPEQGVTRLGFPGGEFTVPLEQVPPGSSMRLRIRARDVSVATEEPRNLSVRNILPAVVEAVEPGRAHEAMLRLRLGPSLLLARVTQDSVRRLGLSAGKPVWALVKAIAFAPGGEAGDTTV
jgi:molybdate transport system ATP-binding protein